MLKIRCFLTAASLLALLQTPPTFFHDAPSQQPRAAGGPYYRSPGTRKIRDRVRPYGRTDRTPRLRGLGECGPGRAARVKNQYEDKQESRGPNLLKVKVKSLRGGLTLELREKTARTKSSSRTDSFLRVLTFWQYMTKSRRRLSCQCPLSCPPNLTDTFTQGSARARRSRAGPAPVTESAITDRISAAGVRSVAAAPPTC